MSRRTELARVEQARLDAIFDHIVSPIEEIDRLAERAAARAIGDISIERATTYLLQHPAIWKLKETKRFSREDFSGIDLRLKLTPGSYAVRSVDIQIKSGARDISKFREGIRGYLQRHGLENPNDDDINLHLARRRLLVLNPRVGFENFMASFEEQMARICEQILEK